MIEIVDKSSCTGCGACKNACPVQAISMQLDEEGFLYPFVDLEKCIQCNRCDEVCHMIKAPAREAECMEVYAAYNKSKEMLHQVSSGGAFWSMAEEMIRRGGVVYGVVMDGALQVYHDRATTLEECERFKRSKYLESHTGNIYSLVKKDILEGREILFSGTGCQIAGLKSFLGEQNVDKLITCDIVCHGVPSRNAFEGYISEIEKQFDSKVIAINYRDKNNGWKRNHICISFENGKMINEFSAINPLHGAYTQGLFYRPSCASCRYACLPRIADITLADYWKYDGDLKKSNEDMGISLVVCNNEKGKLFFKQSAEGRMYIDKSNLEMAQKSCRHLHLSPVEHKKRQQFFKLLKKKGFHKAVAICNHVPLRIKIKHFIKKVLKK